MEDSVPDRVERRLAAILVADMVGYSRLMEVDEAGTIARQKDHREKLIDPAITAHNGRIVKATGDGLLVEFASVVDATESAVAIQRAMAERETDVPEDHRIRYRIGVNLGDIVIDGDDILGEGVNIAARLESLAAPGGICISGKVLDEVRGKVEPAFEDIGEHRVKNIKRAVRVYRVRMAGAAGAEAGPPALELGDKPSVAVLPFDNLSGDPEQEYFSDGITEELITALSRIRWFFVAARNSSFSYKGTSTDVRRIANDLGVRYVLEGSVRKAGNQVRITAQLIDGSTGNHVWAERYDRELGSVFDLQDQITERIVGALEPALSKAEFQRARMKRPDSIGAWDLCQRGWWHRYRSKPEDLDQARLLFEQALEADPYFVSALAGLCEVLSYQVIFSFAEDVDERIEMAVRYGRKAVEIDADDPVALLALGRAYGVAEDYERAIRTLRAALDLNPYFAAAHYALGNVFITCGRLEEGIAAVHKAIELSPQDTWMGGFYSRLAQAFLCMKDYDRAREHAEEALRRPMPVQWWGQSYLVSALGHLGQRDEAKPALEELLRRKPGLTTSWIRSQRSNLSMGPAFLEDYLEGLRKAGLPE
jgi:TolB-like protein/Tfp pilus assembly protein PilF